MCSPMAPTIVFHNGRVRSWPISLSINKVEAGIAAQSLRLLMA